MRSIGFFCNFIESVLFPILLGMFNILSFNTAHAQSPSFPYPETGKKLNGRIYTPYHMFRFDVIKKINKSDGKSDGYDFDTGVFDTRIGRWLASDPLVSQYPGISPYVYAVNIPTIATDPDGKRVRLPSAESLELVKLTVTPEEAEFIQVNKKGFVNKSLLKKGLKSIGLDKISDNYKSLLTLTSKSRIVEITVSQTYETVGGTQTFPSKVVDDYDATWVVGYNGSEDHSGKVTIEGAQYTYDEFKTYYDDNDLGPGIYVPLTQGITLIPEKYITTDWDKSLYTKGAPENSKEKSITKVVINRTVYDINKKQAVRTTAHEAFGHALQSLLGQPAFHGRNRDTDNQDLEKQIKKSVDNAEKNYQLHQKEK